MKNIIKILSLLSIGLLIFSCQDLDRPELGDYPQDTNVPGGPLKFYVAFDGQTNNPLMNAVDSIRAKFPSSNPLSSIDGINGKGLQGQNYKYVKYNSANDFAKEAKSFTISVWAKKGTLKTDHIFSLPSPSDYHWSAASMFLLTEGSVSSPILKFFVKDATGEKWFEWTGANAVTGFYDGNWHHLAFVYDAITSKMTLYKDGIAHPNVPEWVGHGNVNLEPAKITGLKIGAGPQEFTTEQINQGADDWLKNSWNGGIDQFRMYATALNASEVNSLYTKKK
ncbi:hypothetical protein HNP38_000187 [Chryseobacterium defluvii]|uniref:Concanavalin A-like lectin/glucanase superfamily protein n=1 Tax=Chryseobacterium defluvii TaxID=160396 RepID=A0A840K933_9FLAO|nr:LamG domain-containing protein [Chryseobacterium defluvii]MBB4804915.1 hypothetical protein [Chryseobacterium defluvii]